MVVRPIVFIMMGLCWLVGDAQGQSDSERDSPATIEYYYRFESPSFEIEEAQIRFDQSRQGQFIFRRKNEDSIDLELTLLPETQGRIQSLLEQANFFDGAQEYQGDRNLSHLGTVIIRVRRGAQQREVKFNYTRDRAMRALADLFRHIVTQESRIFAIQLARQYEPMDLDRQLTGLQREVKNGWIAEPDKLVPILQSLETDQDLLLIARRRAREILRLIQKR